jgi:hypothetical protein
MLTAPADRYTAGSVSGESPQAATPITAPQAIVVARRRNEAFVFWIIMGSIRYPLDPVEW